jgi:hypothetical protein
MAYGGDDTTSTEAESERNFVAGSSAVMQF